MNRKLIFVGLLLGLFIFPLFLNIHKVNADDKAPVMNKLAGCQNGTALAGCQNGTAEERIECYKNNDKAYDERIECYTNNDKAYRERIFELEVYLAESRAGTDGDACQGQQQGITDLSALLQTCRDDHAEAQRQYDVQKGLLENSRTSEAELARDRRAFSKQLSASEARANVAEEQIKSLTSILEARSPLTEQLTAEVQRLTVNLESCNATRLAREGMLTQQVSECKQDQAQHAQSAQHPVADEPVPDAGPRQQDTRGREGRGTQARHVHANGDVHEDWKPDIAAFDKAYYGIDGHTGEITCEYFLELISLGGLKLNFAEVETLAPACEGVANNRTIPGCVIREKGVWFWSIDGESFYADGNRLLPRDPSGCYFPPDKGEGRDKSCRYIDPEREPRHCQP
jgi:hypothetical protein